MYFIDSFVISGADMHKNLFILFGAFACITAVFLAVGVAPSLADEAVRISVAKTSNSPVIDQTLGANVPMKLSENGVSDLELNSDEDAYRVGSDDELRIIVYGEDELSARYTVSGNGMISMPLIGDVRVSGLTPNQIEAKIVAALSEGYLIDPSVSIEISQYRPFYILGEVRAPGNYAYVNNMSVLNAVAMAGGFTYRADRKYVEILKTGDDHSKMVKDHPVKGSVQPGDIILVKERFF